MAMLGLAVSGAGTGTMMAPLVSYLSEKYGWRTTLKILSGIVLNIALFGALFRPIKQSSKDNSKTENSDACMYKIHPIIQ